MYGCRSSQKPHSDGIQISAALCPDSRHVYMLDPSLERQDKDSSCTREQWYSLTAQLNWRRLMHQSKLSAWFNPFGLEFQPRRNHDKNPALSSFFFPNPANCVKALSDPTISSSSGQGFSSCVVLLRWSSKWLMFAHHGYSYETRRCHPTDHFS